MSELTHEHENTPEKAGTNKGMRCLAEEDALAIKR